MTFLNKTDIVIAVAVMVLIGPVTAPVHAQQIQRSDYDSYNEYIEAVRAANRSKTERRSADQNAPFDLSDYCDNLKAKGRTSSYCSSKSAISSQDSGSSNMTRYCDSLRSQGKTSKYCASQQKVSRSDYDSYQEYIDAVTAVNRGEAPRPNTRTGARGPDPSSMLACEQYSQLVYNHIVGNRTPPPMRQVVIINQRRPTEYEGEITGCGMFSCTVELRETYRSRWNRQFRQTSDNLGQSLENLGYMIGSASARAKLRRNAENQKEAKYKECLRTAGYR